LHDIFPPETAAVVGLPMTNVIDCRMLRGRTFGPHWIRSTLGFSLLELLIVIATMTSLLALLAPALSNVRKSSALNGAGALVAGLANEARQNSLSKNAMTALIVVTDSTVDSRNRLFTMMELLPRADGTPSQSSDWKQICKWETLNSGVIVNNWTVSAQTVPTPMPSLKYGGRVIDQSGFKYLIFMPDGSTLSDQSTTVQLVAGTMPQNTTNPTYTSAATDSYQLTVLNATGRIKIERP
jgi:Tfp pilus assembly protein FimT